MSERASPFCLSGVGKTTVCYIINLKKKFAKNNLNTIVSYNNRESFDIQDTFKIVYANLS